MTIRPVSRQFLGLVAWLALTFAAAFLGAVASARAGDFYRALSRPAWAPPAALFAPVWTLLYLLMATAAWLLWRDHGLRGSGYALWLFILQLALNALWTWVFFQWHLGALAFLEIVLLWLVILATLLSFWRLRPLAGALLLPYLAWVTFAVFLTFSTWKRNPSLLA